MLKIRLQRVGKKHDPSFRVILIDSRKGPKSGSFIENLGFYDAIRKVKQIKADRVKHWISNGAQVSDTVHNILVSEKIVEGKKKNVLPKKSPIVKEKEEAEEKAGETSDEKEVVSEDKAEVTEIPEAPVEEVKEEIKEEVPVEEVSTETEEKKEERKE